MCHILHPMLCSDTYDSHSTYMLVCQPAVKPHLCIAGSISKELLVSQQSKAEQSNLSCSESALLPNPTAKAEKQKPIMQSAHCTTLAHVMQYGVQKYINIPCPYMQRLPQKIDPSALLDCGWWITMQGMECTVTTSKEQNQNQNNNLRKWSHKKRQKRQQRSRPVISKIVVHCILMLATGGQILLTPRRATA